MALAAMCGHSDAGQQIHLLHDVAWYLVAGRRSLPLVRISFILSPFGMFVFPFGMFVFPFGILMFPFAVFVAGRRDLPLVRISFIFVPSYLPVHIRTFRFAPWYSPLHICPFIFFPFTMFVASRRNPPLFLLIHFCIAHLSLSPARLFPTFSFLIFFPSLLSPFIVSASPPSPFFFSPVVFFFFPPFLHPTFPPYSPTHNTVPLADEHHLILEMRLYMDGELVYTFSMILNLAEITSFSDCMHWSVH